MVSGPAARSGILVMCVVRLSVSGWFVSRRFACLPHAVPDQPGSSHGVLARGAALAACGSARGGLRGLHDATRNPIRSLRHGCVDARDERADDRRRCRFAYELCAHGARNRLRGR